MNAAEQLIYLLRLAVVCVSAVILVVILALIRLDVGATTHYHVDTHIAQSLYGSEFWMAPGIVDENLFTNQSLPQFEQGNVPLFADFTLSYGEESKSIVLHPQSAKRLRPLIDVRGLHTETYRLPVTVYPDKAANLSVEVYYELR